MRPQRRREEFSYRADISIPGNEIINDLATLVVRQVHLSPDTVDLQVGLAGEPPVTDCMPARAGRVDRLRGESLDPSVHGHMVHLDTALGAISSKSR